MTGIQLISTTTIRATKHDEKISTHKNIDLTPWDLTLLKIETIQQGLLFHKPKTNQIQHLKQTLSTTLNFFPPLAGRLVITQHVEHNNASCSIICNNLGALFVHAIAENTTIADIIQPNYVPPIVRSLFPLNRVKNYEGTTQPVLAVQVTELIDGIFIGFAINHVVADGVMGIVTMKTEEVMEGGIGKVGMEMNKVISTQSHEKIMNQYESWLKTPFIIVPGMVSKMLLMVNSSPRFNVYGNDFGWGKPIAVRNGVGNKSNGKVTVFAGFEEGSIDVELCLPYDVLEALGNDKLFLDAMSV
ncbi:hypothetical protein TSUD_158150 [Trifolium subterraneum]|uniref:O-acyltransferase WSD1 C-terminal domain-containing protein n=1 Tax=Trifolium subterraneum TaxID=3900 RepID=A0A2Z6MHI9_TRISU|nr:hypothetical protein TSUD_158150 [Trifolium subterraneum]